MVVFRFVEAEGIHFLTNTLGTPSLDSPNLYHLNLVNPFGNSPKVKTGS